MNCDNNKAELVPFHSGHSIFDFFACSLRMFWRNESNCCKIKKSKWNWAGMRMEWFDVWFAAFFNLSSIFFFFVDGLAGANKRKKKKRRRKLKKRSSNQTENINSCLCGHSIIHSANKPNLFDAENRFTAVSFSLFLAVEVISWFLNERSLLRQKIGIFSASLLTRKEKNDAAIRLKPNN